MIKKIISLLMLIALVMTLAVPGTAMAQSGFGVVTSSVKANYPISVTFSISAQSSAEIEDIRLHYSLERDSFANVTAESYVNFQPATKVNTSWTWDMRQTGGLPPGAKITYYWTMKDAAGDTMQTKPDVFQFNDTRFNWQKLTQGQITVYWYDGGSSFGNDLMNTAQTALARLTKDTGAYLKKPITINIYASAADLQGAMIFPQEWTGGVAYTEFGIIAIGIAPDNLTWGERAIAHELTHLVVHQMTFNPYTFLPTWLDEGLATYNEGPMQSDYKSALQQAIKNNSLITVRSLCSSFSAFPNQALLSYAQSQSIVTYLISTYGEPKMLQLLQTFSKGSGYDAALQAVYGFDLDGLNSRWQKYVYQVFQGTGGSTARAEVSPVYAG